MKIKPYLVVYNLAPDATFSCDDINKFNLIVLNHKKLRSDLYPEIINNTNKHTPIIIINAKVHLPRYWYQRLMAVLTQQPDIKLCSALSCKVNVLSPLIFGTEFNGSVSELDNLLYLLQTATTIYTNKINFECFIVRDNHTLKQLTKTTFAACNNLLVQSSTGNKVKATDPVDTGNQKPLPAHALADLQWQLQPYLSSKQSEHGYPLLDNKPIMLHIIMDWGGGVHQWINDYCQHECDYHHFILISSGEFFRYRHGESLTLFYQQTDGLQVQNFELQAPIQVTCIEHPEYKQVLDKIITQYQIQQVVVSSLIGHSMECLQTGLPTLRIFHDYFPSWPSLIANLEQDAINSTDIDKALEQTAHEPFGRISLQQYMLWREHLHKIYQTGQLQLVAPNQSVVNNLTKIDSNSFKDIVVIPHAIAPLQPLSYQNKFKKFQILVLGRINPSKGQQLLEEIMQELGNDYIFILLGTGSAGKKYLKRRNVAVIMEYNNNELQQLLNDTSPDIAIITSQTSETFNYTLSELQQAGICAVSTKFGALKHRIINGKTGFLCDNNVQAFTTTIRNLQHNPAAITAVRTQLQNMEFQTFADEISQYQKLFVPAKNSEYKLVTTTNKINVWVKKLQYLNQQKRSIAKNLKQTQATLNERTLWAQNLTKELQQAEKNIALERKESKYLQQLIKQETARMTTEISKLQSAFNQSQSQYEKTLRQLQQTEVNLSQTQYSKEKVEQKLTSVKQELTSVYQSRSWRATKPMRVFTTWARHKRNAIRFRLAQIKTFPTRAIRSLKTRGIAGTLNTIKLKLNKPQSQQPQKTIELTQNFKAITITLNSKSKPMVSIIIPVYNHFEHTYNCLKSIAELQDKTSFEVIVIDDCSSDDTQNLIKNIAGITYHRQKKNSGFIESCNTGAKLAVGQYLLFLNNDTIVHDAWLDSLMQIFSDYSDAGLVGSKLIYPNNQLQEAGGIVFADGSGWNYGRLGEADEPWYNHVREVDYCSGASILIATDLFTKLGAFDVRYKPAYYEDTDLAFAVRNIGKKVYYQPASQVTHFEGISAGTDLATGMKKYQVLNQTKFKQKWAKALTQQPKPATNIELCRIHGQPKRILIYDACTPTPDQDAGSLRMINLIKILKELDYHVIFMPENLSYDDAYTQTLQQLGVECIYTPTISNPVDYLKEKGKFLTAVLLSRYYVAEQLMPFIREYCPNAQIIFDSVDLHYVRERRMAEITNDKKLAQIAEKTRTKELAVARACDLTLVVSPYEVTVLQPELADTTVKVLSTIHAIYGCRKSFKQRKDIMFIGGYQHTPNIDAVEWFVTEIFPLIVTELPELKFHIIGSKAPKHIRQMASKNIIFHGFVEDIEPFMDDIRIAVAPLRYGAGIKGKVNMSMSYGQPVVGTSCAVEGMFTVDEKDCLMAETPKQFAQQVIRLYQDEQLWKQISQGGLENVQNYFSFAAAKKAIQDILKAID
ncbi:Glycosyltransferase [hydrothermal vent metagenome]|uniref:Glycosyltransferase n=1 Tax=hydrothermal vent metagenome TaxID=652676 RepID=A0A3B0VFJ5_9ZZZZ